MRIFNRFLPLMVMAACPFVSFADLVTVQGPGITSFTVLNNGSIFDPLIPGQFFPMVPIAPFSNGLFSVTGFTLTAANFKFLNGGVAYMTGALKVTDITGGQEQISIDVQQGYTRLVPELYVGALVGSF